MRPIVRCIFKAVQTVDREYVSTCPSVKAETHFKELKSILNEHSFFFLMISCGG